jgi:hypothetical protein
MIHEAHVCMWWLWTFIQGTWASTHFGTLGVFWKESPLDSEGKLYSVKICVVHCLVKSTLCKGKDGKTNLQNNGYNMLLFIFKNIVDCGLAQVVEYLASTRAWGQIPIVQKKKKKLKKKILKL